MADTIQITDQNLEEGEAVGKVPEVAKISKNIMFMAHTI